MNRMGLIIFVFAFVLTACMGEPQSGSTGYTIYEPLIDTVQKANEPAANELTRSKVIDLLTESKQQYFDVFSLGCISAKFGDDIHAQFVDVESRKVPDSYLYYYCPELDSVEKIKNYLSKVQSKDVIDLNINESLANGGIIEINGKLAYIPLDGLKAYNWDTLKIDIVNQDKDRIEAELRAVDYFLREETLLQAKFTHEDNQWKVTGYPQEVGRPTQEIKQTDESD